MLNIEFKFKKVAVSVNEGLGIVFPALIGQFGCVRTVWMWYLSLYMQIIYQNFDLKRFQ